MLTVLWLRVKRTISQVFFTTIGCFSSKKFFFCQNGSTLVIDFCDTSKVFDSLKRFFLFNLFVFSRIWFLVILVPSVRLKIKKKILEKFYWSFLRNFFFSFFFAVYLRTVISGRRTKIATISFITVCS